MPLKFEIYRLQAHQSNFEMSTVDPGNGSTLSRTAFTARHFFGSPVDHSKFDWWACNRPNKFKLGFLTKQSTEINNLQSFKIRINKNPEIPGFSPLEAPLSTRFSIRNAKNDAVREPLIGLFFFVDIWIQREKLD